MQFDVRGAFEMPSDRIVSAFEQGKNAARQDQPSASNPYMPSTEQELWQAWALGYDEEEPRYVIRPRIGTLGLKLKEALEGVMTTEEREFVEAEGMVHLALGEFTLCGDAFDLASEERGYGWASTRKRTVTCNRCAGIIRKCRGVRTQELSHDD